MSPTTSNSTINSPRKPPSSSRISLSPTDVSSKSVKNASKLLNVYSNPTSSTSNNQVPPPPHSILNTKIEFVNLEVWRKCCSIQFNKPTSISVVPYSDTSSSEADHPCTLVSPPD